MEMKFWKYCKDLPILFLIPMVMDSCINLHECLKKKKNLLFITYFDIESILCNLCSECAINLTEMIHHRHLVQLHHFLMKMYGPI